MGWFLDDPAHEGYLVGVVQIVRPFGSGYLRELNYREDCDREVGPDGLSLHSIQVGCDCGWRSRRFVAPLSARWFPCHVEVDERTEAAAVSLWREHYEAEQQRKFPHLTPKET